MDNHVQKQAYQFTVRFFFFESLNDGTGYHTDKRGLHYAKTVVVGTCRYLSVTELTFLQAAEFNG